MYSSSGLSSLSAATWPSSSTHELSSLLISVPLVSSSSLSSAVFSLAVVSSLFSESFSASSPSFAFSRFRHFARRFWNQTCRNETGAYFQNITLKKSLSILISLFTSSMWFHTITFIILIPMKKPAAEPTFYIKSSHCKLNHFKVAVLKILLCATFIVAISV